MRGVRECPTLTLGGTGPHSTLVRAATRHRSIPAANISVGNAVRVPAYHLSSSVWQEVLKTAEHRQGIIPLLVLHNCKECHTTSVYPTESPEVWVRGGVVFFFLSFLFAKWSALVFLTPSEIECCDRTALNDHLKAAIQWW